MKEAARSSEEKKRITVKEETESEIIEKRSRFIATVKPVKDEKEAQEFITRIKEKYRDATHNVFAYFIDFGTYARYSDDGEPQGTAGMPVLNVLKMSGMTDLCVVVTRYFGGILLGAGGLVRAYSAAAKAALDDAEHVIFEPFSIVRTNVSYSEYQKLVKNADNFGITIEETVFSEDVTIVFSVPDPLIGRIKDGIRDLTSGKATFTVICKEERPSPYFD